MAIPAQLLEIVADEADAIVPVIGAGLAVDSGVPDARSLARLLAEPFPYVVDQGFDDACRQIEAREGVEVLQGSIAEIIAACETQPNPTLELLARCPGRLLATTNYDFAIEDAVVAAGCTPETLLVSDLGAGQQPSASTGVVRVVHLHGHIEAPPTMVISTSQRQSLAANQAFVQSFRTLSLGRRLLCLGYQLGLAEDHLRAELNWLSAVYPQQPTALLFLPADERPSRSDLDLLEADGKLKIFCFDPGARFGPVRQLALALAPSPCDADDQVTTQAQSPSPYYLAPALLEVGEETDFETEAHMAEFGFTEHQYSEPEALLDRGRTLLVAAPGLGKSELLRKLGSLEPDRAVLIHASAIHPRAAAGAAAVAEALSRNALAFGSVVRPNRDRLGEHSYLLLIDGLDEVGEDERADVVQALLAAIDEWPHQAWVVASRAVAQTTELRAAGFSEFRISPSPRWGWDYLERRGVDDELRGQASDRLSALRTHLAVPRYATRIAELLIECDDVSELPETALELLLSAEPAAVEHEAERVGASANDLYDWMQRLAVGLELGGRNSASIEELRELRGAGSLSSIESRERLIQDAFLRDEPETARFNTTVTQEALCAEAVLAAADPVTALREVAVAVIDASETLRGDLEHVLDLIFEAATYEDRQRLRQIDELRWAQTMLSSAGAELAAEAIDVIRAWHSQRRVWLQSLSENNLRGPGEAVRYLTTAHPHVLEARRQQLGAQTNDPQPTIRHNAIELLTLLERDDQTAQIVGRLLGDDNEVVRRHAAHAVEHFRLVELGPQLRQAWQETFDELELDAIGRALLALTPDDQLEELVGFMTEKRIGWRRTSYHAVARLSLTQLANLIVSDRFPADDIAEALKPRLEQADELGPNDVYELARILMATDARPYASSGGEVIPRLAARYPDQALAGAEVACAEEAEFIDIYWMRVISRDRLAAVTDGPLAPAIAALVTRIDAWAAQSADPEAGSPAGAWAESAADSENTLLHDLEAGKIGPHTVPQHFALWQVETFPAEAQQQFLALAEQWAGEPRIDRPQRDQGRLGITNGLWAALTVWAALDHPVGRQRWLSLLAAGVLAFDDRYRKWAAAQFQPQWSADAAAVVERFDHVDDLQAAASVIAVWDEQICAVFAQHLVAAASGEVDYYLAKLIALRLREADDHAALRQLAESALDESVRELALGQLAEMGDVAAQRQSAETLAGQIDSASVELDHHQPGWLATIESAELIPELEILLRRSHGNDDLPLLRRSIDAALARTGSEEALAVYDRLMVDPDLRNAQFYCYQRQALARELARRCVIARLPADLPGLSALLVTT